MKIEHIAIWTKNLEQLKIFYETYFQAVSGDKYTNNKKQFESYFLEFSSGTRLELMQMPSVPDLLKDPVSQHTGYIHMAISVGSKTAVNSLTRKLQDDGYRIINAPRRTGDGYYESVVLDPDGNRIEITV
jgi:lactoylglutathione lyase